MAAKVDLPRMVVFAATFTAVAILVGLGKVESKYLEMALIWLASMVDGKILAPKSVAENRK